MTNCEKDDCILINIDNFANFGCKNKCEFVKTNCIDDDTTVGFLKIFYCTVNESTLCTILFMVNPIFVFKKIFFKMLKSDK